jgi:thymidylate synthase (FAD)
MAYNDLLEAGVAPEQARMVLPQNTMTEWYWSGSLMAFARVCKQRLDPHAQAETREVAEGIDKECADLFPVSWSALKGE